MSFLVKCFLYTRTLARNFVSRYLVSLMHSSLQVEQMVACTRLALTHVIYILSIYNRYIIYVYIYIFYIYIYLFVCVCVYLKNMFKLEVTEINEKLSDKYWTPKLNKILPKKSL